MYIGKVSLLHLLEGIFKFLSSILPLFWTLTMTIRGGQLGDIVERGLKNSSSKIALESDHVLDCLS